MKQFVKRNAATILTSVGAAGVVVTSVLTAKATIKAVDILDDAKFEKGEALTTIEKVKVALPVYIPPILTGVGTITCIFGANVLNKQHQASLMSAYTLLNESYKEYRNKVYELYGEEAEAKIEELLIYDHCPRRR